MGACLRASVLGVIACLRACVLDVLACLHALYSRAYFFLSSYFFCLCFAYGKDNGLANEKYL